MNPTDGTGQPEGRSGAQTRQKAQEASQALPLRPAPISPAAAQAGTAEQAATPPEAGDLGEQTHAPPGRPEDAQHQRGKEQVLARPKTPVQPPDQRVQAHARRPKLAVSTLRVDFRHMPVGSKPSPRRVKVRNVGGGDLNARIASAPLWVQAELRGGILTLKPDPKAPGSLLGDVLVDSDGGSATIRVTATADPPSVPHARAYYQGHELATWWRRAVAYLIDWFAVLVIPIFTFNLRIGSGIYISFIGLVVILVIWLYNRCYLQGRTGQSWGKRAMGLKLIHVSDKETIGSGKAAVRDLAHVADIATLYLWPIRDAQRQTLADKLMETVVISLKA
jgi:uncharacterized RDD family membrane protein YckC